MSEKLKPCPFCGEEAESCGYPGHGGTEQFQCSYNNCDAHHIQSSALKWDCRPLEQELVEALKGLVAAAEMTTFSDQFPAECEAANQAIAKAEGKSPNNQTNGVASI